MKTWKDIRTETVGLGFEKIKVYDKNRQAWVEAYNWRQALIASTVGGVPAKIGIGCNGDHRHIFDLEDMANNYGEEFVAVAQIGVTDMNNNSIDGWRLTDNRFLEMPSGYKGHRIVNILAMPARLTVSSADETECQLPAKWRNLMPYLMASRLFLDDDASRAGYYWNVYTDMRDEILARENSIGVSVVGGTDIDGWCI